MSDDGLPSSRLGYPPPVRARVKAAYLDSSVKRKNETEVQPVV